jgi:hypothetical protein
MSDSSKQRIFFENAIRIIKKLGCDVVVDYSKHFIARITRNNRRGIWTVSKTPKNRFAAQRAALGDLKRLLRELGVDLGGQDFQAGMLHMQIPSQAMSANSELDALIEREAFMNKKLFEEVLKHSYPNLTADNQSTILDITEEIISSPQTSPSTDRNSAGAYPTDWAVLDPLASTAGKCQRRVLVFASDRNWSIPQWSRSFTLKAALQGLMDYYHHCHKVTELGVLVTNVWRPGELSAFKRDIESFEQSGIQSVAIFVSNHLALPINWPWR